uniref:Uncharacterized protein n=1 Tax=Anguilla anguilla TaxID=7936 RepID=A0A0E9WZB0_ANGAN
MQDCKTICSCLPRLLMYNSVPNNIVMNASHRPFFIYFFTGENQNITYCFNSVETYQHTGIGMGTANQRAVREQTDPR